MKTETPTIWVNGVAADSLPVTDRGLSYGDGLFETIRITSGKATLIELHLRRLSESAAQLGIFLDLPLLEAEMSAFLSCFTSRDGILKVILTRGSGGRGYNPDGCRASSRVLSFHPLPVYPSNPAANGICLYPCKTRLGQSVLAGIKHLNRLENVLARGEWQGSDCLEGLLMNFDGSLVEGTMSNLFLVRQGILETPDLSRSGVKGVCREYILQQAEEWQLPVRESALTLSDLEQAEEVFVCNSVNGVWPVVSYENLSWTIGSVTRQVQDRVQGVLNG